jgi:pilus assembly protein CpaE
MTSLYMDEQPAAPSGRVPIVVVDPDPARRAALVTAIAPDVARELYAIEDLEDQLQPTEAAIVLLGASMSDTIGLSSVERLARLYPQTACILIVEDLSTEVLQRALRAGVKDVLTAPIDPVQLAQTVNRIVATLVPTEPKLNPDAVPQEGGRVVTVFSTKGGAGKSVIAANLAVVLARRTDAPVVLIDADLQFGDIAVMLKLAPQHTIVDAVNAAEKLDATLMDTILVRHEPSGVLVLPAPLEPAFADQVGSAQMQRIVDMLRKQAAYIVVDTPAYFNDVVLGLLENSDDVLLVAGMDIPNIKNVKIGLQTLRLLNIPLSKLKLILNRANSKVKLDVSEVERTLGIKADVLIPSDVLVPQCVNKGVAVVLDSPRSGVAKSIEELADLVDSAKAAPSSSAVGKFFRR